MEAVTSDSVALEAVEPKGKPDTPSLSAGVWVRKNLFSTPFNSALTIVFGLIGLLAVRALLNFTFSEEREWDAVRTNLRLIFTHAYPEEQYNRVWVCVGILVVLAGLSVGLAVSRGRGASMKKLSMSLMGWGATIALCIVLREPSALKNPDGTAMRDDDGVIRESFAEAMADRAWWWLVAVVLAGAGAAIWIRLGDVRRRSTFVPVVELAIALVGLLVLSAWIFPWGHYAFVTQEVNGISEGVFIAEPGRTVAMTTKVPWTIMWLLLVAAIVVGRRLRSAGLQSRVSVFVIFAWLLSPFFLYWVVLRDPHLEYSRVFSVDVPLAVGFAALGSVILWMLTNPRIGELGRVVAILLMGIAAFNWIVAFFGWYSMLQKVRISFLLLALVALVAHNFAGDKAKRLRLVWFWLAGTAVFNYLATMMNTPSTVDTPTEALIGGFSVTLIVATFTLMCSFPLGVLLALGRTSKLPIFRVLSTSYIEVVRGVPLITLLIFFVVVLPLFLPDSMQISDLTSATLAYVLFSAAYLAENVRGGLQSVRRGQYEASDAVGLSTSQRTSFIVLPQALRVSIPPLVGQTIATFKETSLLAIIGLFDLLRMANSVIPAQTQFLGVKREGLLFVCLVYWVFAYAMSKQSQRLEKKLGLGER